MLAIMACKSQLEHKQGSESGNETARLGSGTRLRHRAHLAFSGSMGRSYGTPFVSING